VKALPAARGFVLGLDSEQVEGVDRGLIAGAGRRVQVGEVVGSGRGYFKLRRGPPGDVIDENGDEGVPSKHTSKRRWRRRCALLNDASLPGYHPCFPDGLSLAFVCSVFAPPACGEERT